MKLYSYWRSSCSWRVRLALNLKGIDYTLEPVHLVEGKQSQDDYVAKNPSKQVPTLEWEDSGQTRILSQSLAIIDYLEQTHPQPPLWPKDPFLRAKAWQLAEIVNAGTQPLQNFAVLKHVKAQANIEAQPWASHFIRCGLEALERAAEPYAGQYLVGDTMSVADLCLIPQLYNARRFEVKLEDLPTLLRVEAACETQDAFVRAHPDQQPDAPAS